MGATLNGSPCVSVRLVMPYRGVWCADVDLDPEVAAAIPTTGPAALVIGAAPSPVTTLTGIIDPLGAGAFVATVRMRVLGGKGGWSKTVQAQAFAPSTTTTIYNAVASQVLEEVSDLVPASIPGGYFLAAGPASAVFGPTTPWWVDLLTGVTFAGGPRPPAVPDPSLEILTWDPLQQLAEVSCDALVLPGTPLVDVRIPSPVIVRDVEQVFGPKGSRARCWCSSNAVSPLQAMLQLLIRQFAGVTFLPQRLYRVVAPGAQPNTWTCQAVERGLVGQASPMPDAISLTAWTGAAGVTAKLAPSSEVLVGFIDGDPKQAIVVSYSTSALPLQVTVDATAMVQIGPTALAVAIGGGGAGVARAGDPIDVSKLVVTAPSGGGACVVSGAATIASGSLKVTSG